MGQKKYTGLTSARARELLNQNGKNTLKQKKKKSAISIFLNQFTDVMVLILMVCTVISAFMNDWLEAVVMIAIVIVNAILGFIQEYRTEKTIEALGKLTTAHATVIRDGSKKKIPVDQVVTGDVCLIFTGDRVPADGFIISGEGLSFDESMLTGESEPVSKSEGPVYMGTGVLTGHGMIGITETGMQTQMGQISNMIQEEEEEQTPLQKRLARMGRYIVLACLGICIIVTAVGILRGQPVISMLLTGISLAVAAVPEGLPAIVTIALALGVSRMAECNALVRRLPAVETLGCTDVICSDKTGTLTQNKMAVKRVKTFRSEIPPEDICMECNNESDSTERALAEHFTQYKKGEYTRIREYPFDSVHKTMTVVVENRMGMRYAFSKGAPEKLIGRGDRNAARETEAMAASALRVLAVSCIRLEPEDNIDDRILLERKVQLAALIGLADPVRPEAAEAVKQCKTAGIRTVMITGDHKLTAGAIGKELGIIDTQGQIMTGAQMENLSDEELAEKVDKISVFARVQPVHKLRIVKAFKALGKTVAMTGDGVNDAPAVKAADIGIAMGKSGTDVTREASDMVLTDDNFATIVKAVKEGRAIYENIKKFIRYMLACNLGEVVTMFIGILCGLPLPLFPIQVLWVNLATDGLPGIALGMDNPAPDIMNRKPVPASRGIFSGRMPWQIITRGILIGLCTLGVFMTIQWTGGSLDIARTGAFTTLVLTQLVHSFECRGSYDIRGNMFLVAAVALSFMMVLAVIYVGYLQVIFHTVALGIWHWGIICGFTALVPILGGMLDGFVKGRKWW